MRPGRQRTDKAGQAFIAQQHGAANPAQQAATQCNHHRETIHQLHHDLAAPYNDRDTDHDTEHHQRHMATGCPGNGNHVIDTHHGIGHDNGFDRTPQVGTAVYVVAIVVLTHQQLHTDPQQQQAAYQFQERDIQNLQCKRNQHHAQANGTHHAPENAFLAQVFRQAAASQGDNDRVIATQQNINGDNLQHRNPEGAFTHHFKHLVILPQNFYNEQP